MGVPKCVNIYSPENPSVPEEPGAARRRMGRRKRGEAGKGVLGIWNRHLLDDVTNTPAAPHGQSHRTRIPDSHSHALQLWVPPGSAAPVCSHSCGEQRRQTAGGEERGRRETLEGERERELRCYVAFSFVFFFCGQQLSTP